MRSAFEENTAAFEQTVRAVIGLAEEFTEAEWELPTDCPGWTVKDMVSHLVGAEELFLGDPLPAHDLPDLPHVQNELGRMVELGVDVRRPLPGARVLDQLKAVLERRLAMLAEVDPAAEAPQPDGRPGDYTRLMMFRAFDCWIHEQDIRRATGRPGGLDAPAAAATRNQPPSAPATAAKRTAPNITPTPDQAGRTRPSRAHNDSTARSRAAANAASSSSGVAADPGPSPGELPARHRQDRA